jgi:hypothetical protein
MEVQDRGRPRDYCGRACQSKAYRRRVADERARLRKADKSARAEKATDLPAVDPGRTSESTGDVDFDDSREGQPDATPRESMEILNRQLAQLTERYLRELDEGADPDLATAHLTFHGSVQLSRLFHAARQVRAQLYPATSEGLTPWEEALEGFAQMVAFQDPAALPGVHLAQQVGPGPELPEPVPAADPQARLGWADLSMPLVAAGLWPHWDLAGWRQDPSMVLVRHQRLVAGRAELVGTHWLAVAGTRYLREGTGASRGHLLRWFPSARAAAVALAQRHQGQWSEHDPADTAATAR